MASSLTLLCEFIFQFGKLYNNQYELFTPTVMQMSTLQDELALVRPFRNRQRKNQQNKEGVADESATKIVEDGVAETEGVAIKSEDGAENQTAEGEVKMDEEPVVEGPPLILDYEEGDDLSEKTRENLPKYLPDRALGVSFITDYTCKQCTLCRKLFDSEETAAVHARTYKHFQSFLRLVHSKGNFKTKQVGFIYLYSFVFYMGMFT